MNSEIMLIADAVTVIMLAAALIYGVKLNASIEAFLKSRNEWAAVFRGFDSAVAQAQAHLKKLSDEAYGTAADLQRHTDEARLAMDDLRAMVDRAERTLDVALLKKEGSRPAQKPAPSEFNVKLSEFAAPARPRPEATTPKERASQAAKPAALFESIRGAKPSPAASAARPIDEDDERTRKQKIFEKMLERASGKMYPPSSGAASSDNPPETLRRALAALGKNDEGA